jgi:beta-N-acetylhexosaminidase
MQTSRLLMINLSGLTLTPDEKSFLSEHKVGGICLFGRNLRDRFQAADYIAELRSLLGEEVLIAIDQEGGMVARLLDVPLSPGAMALGAANDPQLTYQVARAMARGLRSVGVNINFAPCADVNNNPLNPVISDRSFGSDPVKVASQVVAYLQGMQTEGVAATVKHFPGHGDTSTDSHLDLPKLDVSRERLEELEFIPFKAGIAAGVAAVMSYHGLVPALDPDSPSTLSKTVITSVLRDELGFDGVVFTDALDMAAITKLFTPSEAVIRALAAGVDMPLSLGSLELQETVLKDVEQALPDGRLEPKTIERSLERVSRLAKRYGSQADVNGAWSEGDEALLLKAARQSVVQLGSIKPLNVNQKLCLVGASNAVGGAASMMMTSPLVGLASALEQKGFPVTTLLYDRNHLAETRYSILNQLVNFDVTLFVSTSRTRMQGDEKKLALEVAGTAKGFIHLALWNPYSVQDLPAPALVSFGFRPESVGAVAEVLAGGEALGVLPTSIVVPE